VADRAPPEEPRGAPTDVALFMPTLTGGGAERVQLVLAQYLVAQGLRVDVVVCKRIGALSGSVPPGARLVDLGARRVLLGLTRYERYLRRDRPRIVISSVENASVIACAARARGVHPHRLVVRQDNAVVSGRTAWGEPRRWLWLLILRLAFRFADHLIAVSDGVAVQLRQTLGAAASRVSRIYNPVILPDFAARLGAAPGAATGAAPGAATEAATAADRAADDAAGRVPTVAAAGRLHPVKDYPTLLRAFAALRRRMRARLVIMGEGEARGALEALAKDLGIAGDVAFTGFVSDPLPAIRAADVFVLSSLSEGLGGVLIEALAAGTPVVSTDCRYGPREVLGDGRFGQLVPVGDAYALAAAITRALDAPRPGAAPDLQAHLARFALDHVGRAYLSLIGDLVPGLRETGRPR
jgi:glycosyltransferase involved in cell wall biosynthesis